MNFALAATDPAPLSSTQLSTFELCPRKWGWSKLEDMRFPPNASAQFGIETHGHLESYYKIGKPIDLTTKTGDLALAMLPYGPPLGAPGLEVEEWFYIDFWGHRLRGKKDAELPAVVWDWKSTSDLMWAKNACPNDAGTMTVLDKDGQEEIVCARCGGAIDRAGRCEKALVNDIAACVYALDSMIKSGLDYAHLRWVYGTRKKPHKVRPVDAVLTRDAIVPTLLRVKKLADEIAALPPGIRALDLPYDANACTAFGGCPFVGLCNLSQEERMRSNMHQDLEAQKQAFYAHAEKLKQQQGGFGYAVNPPPQGQNMNQGPPQFQGAPNGQPQFQGAPQGGFTPPPGQGGPPPGGFGPPGQFQGPPQGGPPGGFAPPQTVNGTPAHPGWAPQQGGPPPGQYQQQPQGGPPGGFAPQGQQQGGAPQFAPQGQEQAPKKGAAGRPKGSKNKQVQAASGETSRAMAYQLLSQGFAMLAACEEDDSEG